jgi:hypothetical protein
MINPAYAHAPLWPMSSLSTDRTFKNTIFYGDGWQLFSCMLPLLLPHATSVQSVYHPLLTLASHTDWTQENIKRSAPRQLTTIKTETDVPHQLPLLRPTRLHLRHLRGTHLQHSHFHRPRDDHLQQRSAILHLQYLRSSLKLFERLLVSLAL